MSDSNDGTPPQPRGDRPARGDQPPHRRTGPTAFGVLRTAISRLGSDRGLSLPFLLAGIVVAVVDTARRLDPIPVAHMREEGVSIDVAYYLFPAGSLEAVRPLGAIVELRAQYLLWAVGLEIAALLAIGLAGWIVFTGELDRPTDLAAAGRYFGVFSLIIAIPRLLGGANVEFTDGGLIFGIPFIVLWMLLFVRLFLLPVFLLTGHGVIEALRESRRTSRGAGWTIFGLILAVGLGASLLGGLPAIGGGLSTAIVGPLHAVAAVSLYERLTPSAAQ